MTTHSPPETQSCRIAVGLEGVVALRANDPLVAVVALIDQARPGDVVLAQVAGADIVLPAADLSLDHSLHPGIDVAIRSASTMAAGRRRLAAEAKRVGHDLAEALNVVSLIADAGEQGRVEAHEGFGSVVRTARDASADAWRARQAFRLAPLVIAATDLGRWFAQFDLGVDVVWHGTTDETHVLVDRRWLSGALVELVGNASRAGAAWVAIEVHVDPSLDTIDLIVSDDGPGFPSSRIDLSQPFNSTHGRVGVGLASIAEAATHMGGSLRIVTGGPTSQLTKVAITLRRLNVQTFGHDIASAIQTSPTEAQAEILEGVVRHAPLGESLEGIVGAIENRLRGTMCSILLLHEGQLLRHGAGQRLPLSYREAIDGVSIGTGQGSCGTAAFTGKPVIATDVRTDPNWVDFRTLAEHHGLRSCWSTPIIAAGSGEMLGTFAVYTPLVWAPDEGAIRLVNRFTYLAAVAIEHHRLFGALAESEARFRSAFEGANAGIALATVSGIVFKSNPALSVITGTGPDGPNGYCLLDFVEPECRRKLFDRWSELSTSIDSAASIPPVEVTLTAERDGSPIWVSIHTSLIAGERERPAYLYVEMRDITAVRQQLRDTRAREMAEAANSAKSDFLALASHELRTPLNAILGFAQVMQLVDLDSDQVSDSVAQIVVAGQHLRDLIAELLDLSRIEAGQLMAEMRPVPVCRVIEEAVDLLAPLANARGIRLVAQLDAVQTAEVVGDRRCLRQVLLNLLGNALKYTPSGGNVEVTVQYREESAVRVTVTDSGAGISADSLDRIFEPFHRLDKATESGSEGTGLGLAVCERLMREMNGSIGVASREGVGSTFWIEFMAPGRLDLTKGSRPSEVDGFAKAVRSI